MKTQLICCFKWQLLKYVVCRTLREPPLVWIPHNRGLNGLRKEGISPEKCDFSRAVHWDGRCGWMAGQHFDCLMWEVLTSPRWVGPQDFSLTVSSKAPAQVIITLALTLPHSYKLLSSAPQTCLRRLSHSSAARELGLKQTTLACTLHASSRIQTLTWLWTST